MVMSGEFVTTLARQLVMKRELKKTSNFTDYRRK